MGWSEMRVNYGSGSSRGGVKKVTSAVTTLRLKRRDLDKMQVK
jgi:hypothetical protein